MHRFLVARRQMHQSCRLASTRACGWVRFHVCIQ